MGTPPDFGAPASEVVDYLGEERTRIQIGAAIHALWAPFLVWFLATVVSLADDGGPAARRTGLVAFGCGIAFLALFLSDVGAVAVAALRPANMAAAPELAVALHDYSWLAMGMASLLVTGMLTAFALLSLREKLVWPTWLGWLGVVAGGAYALRVGTLMTTEGAFAADGLFGLWVPVVAVAGWLVAASILLTLDILRRDLNRAPV